MPLKVEILGLSNGASFRSLREYTSQVEKNFTVVVYDKKGKVNITGMSVS